MRGFALVGSQSSATGTGFGKENTVDQELDPTGVGRVAVLCDRKGCWARADGRAAARPCLNALSSEVARGYARRSHCILMRLPRVGPLIAGQLEVKRRSIRWDKCLPTTVCHLRGKREEVGTDASRSLTAARLRQSPLSAFACAEIRGFACGETARNGI